MKHLENWRDVWPAYFDGKPLPPLRLRRRHITLHHTLHDGPVPLVLEIFGDHCYHRFMRAPRKGVIVDIGANIGVFTLYWATRSEDTTFQAYEPNPETSRTLRLNLEANGLSGRVKIYDEAVGRESAEAKIWTNVPSLIASVNVAMPPTPEAVSLSVPMIDLNEVVRRAGDTVELLKIDAEGAEADILEGATADTLLKVKQVVLEYHEHLCQSALARSRQVLERAGFRCRVKPDKSNRTSMGLLYATRDSR